MSDGTVRCWGKNVGGQCGYGAEGFDIGDGETPASMGNVDVGSGVIVDIAAGGDSTCVLLQGGAVRCWGLGAGGKLGYGNVEDIGDNEIPATAGDVAVGGSVQRFSVGVGHVCVVLTTGALKCWGNGPFGRLGYGNTNNIGDNESPSSVGPVPF
jgi:alpha-tubulin suppressor-like RCC1 family protein